LASTNNSESPSRAGRWFWLVFAILAVIFGYFYFRSAPLRVHAGTVRRGPIRSMVSTNGKIEPIQNFEAHAPIATTVRRLLVKEGDHVRKGQILLELDDSDVRSQAARAEAQVKAAAADQAELSTGGTQEELIALNTQLAKAKSARDAAQQNLDALRRLLQQGAASPGEVRVAEGILENAQADVTQAVQKKKERYSQPEVAKIQSQATEAQAAYDAAEDTLAKSEVRAPFEGMIYSLPVKLGTFVQAGDLLVQEADLSRVLVRAFVDEPDIARLQPGQKVEITWDAIPGRTWTGTVATVPSAVKPRQNRNVGETTCIVDNSDLKLLPNVNVGVSIIAAEHDNVLTLQRDALHADDTMPFVYSIVDNRLHRQPVQISLLNLTRVEITSGLAEGSVVALSSDDGRPLADGAAVKIVP
jgi:HlyD family secretion protein